MPAAEAFATENLFDVPGFAMWDPWGRPGPLAVEGAGPRRVRLAEGGVAVSPFGQPVNISRAYTAYANGGGFS